MWNSEKKSTGALVEIPRETPEEILSEIIDDIPRGSIEEIPKKNPEKIPSVIP